MLGPASRQQTGLVQRLRTPTTKVPRQAVRPMKALPAMLREHSVLLQTMHRVLLHRLKVIRRHSCCADCFAAIMIRGMSCITQHCSHNLRLELNLYVQTCDARSQVSRLALCSMLPFEKPCNMLLAVGPMTACYRPSWPPCSAMSTKNICVYVCSPLITDLPCIILS